MTERRQRPIPVTSQERQLLEEQKKKYESQSGNAGDWGQFLGTMALLGLAAVGIYALASILRQDQRSLNVRCARCNGDFTVALQPNSGTAILVNCPHCHSELVLQLQMP